YLREVYRPPVVSDGGLVPLLPSCNISQLRGEKCLVRWVISRLHDIEELSGMVDPSIRAAKVLYRFADVISLCVQFEQGFRPSMSEIVQSLLHMIKRNL
nr:protein STRUBBELIG-receptor family 3-like [Tanacetum cinerariifolium]